MRFALAIFLAAALGATAHAQQSSQTQILGFTWEMTAEQQVEHLESLFSDSRTIRERLCLVENPSFNRDKIYKTESGLISTKDYIQSLTQ